MKTKKNLPEPEKINTILYIKRFYPAYPGRRQSLNAAGRPLRRIGFQGCAVQQAHVEVFVSGGFAAGVQRVPRLQEFYLLRL